MLDDLKRHPEKIPLYLVVVLVAVIGFPYTFTLMAVGVIGIVMDEVFHCPKWLTALAVNVLFVAGLIVLAEVTGWDLSTSSEVPTCSAPGC